MSERLANERWEAKETDRWLLNDRRMVEKMVGYGETRRLCWKDAQQLSKHTHTHTHTHTFQKKKQILCLKLLGGFLFLFFP